MLTGNVKITMFKQPINKYLTTTTRKQISTIVYTCHYTIINDTVSTDMSICWCKSTQRAQTLPRPLHWCPVAWASKCQI